MTNKKSNKNRYWDISRILSKGADYNIVIGERSNGKTYGTLEYALKKYVADGSEVAYIRRWDEDIRGRRASKVWDSLVTSGAVSRITNGEYKSISYYAGCWYLSNFDETLNKFVKAPTPFCYAFSLSSMEHDKSTSYDNVNTIIFDEFLTRKYYLNDEFVIFLNVISTIIRDRDNVKIFMLGNTVNKYCPYFAEFGLKHIQDMQQGKIDVYSYGKKGKTLTVAVEFCGNGKSSKPSDKYFAFDNPKLKMITKGTWELAIYPHLPQGYRIKDRDIVFSYFIVFNDNILQGDIVSDDKSLFTYIHKKTTPIKNPDMDMIYSLEDTPLPNHFKDLLSNATKIQSKVAWFFVSKKVFYQSNEIGEIVRNFIAQSSHKPI